MTEREMLELLLTKVSGLETRFDRLEGRMDRLEERMDRLEERMDGLEERMDRLEGRMDRLEERVSALEEDVASLKEDTKELQELQRITTSELEGTVGKSIQVLYECHQMNAERFDRADIDSIRNNSEIAVTLAKSAYDTIEKKLKVS